MPPIDNILNFKIFRQPPVLACRRPKLVRVDMALDSIHLVSWTLIWLWNKCCMTYRQIQHTNNLLCNFSCKTIKKISTSYIFYSVVTVTVDLTLYAVFLESEQPFHNCQTEWLWPKSYLQFNRYSNENLTLFHLLFNILPFIGNPLLIAHRYSPQVN
jgi:hypothetical protein